MKTYTEEEIKEWFNKMEEKFPNSYNLLEYLAVVEDMMFHGLYGDDEYCLESVKKEDRQIK